jgi:hypothetical protein
MYAYNVYNVKMYVCIYVLLRNCICVFNHTDNSVNFLCNVIQEKEGMDPVLWIHVSKDHSSIQLWKLVISTSIVAMNFDTVITHIYYL